jgi:protein tyrosine/serine phosphatase
MKFSSWLLIIFLLILSIPMTALANDDYGVENYQQQTDRISRSARPDYEAIKKLVERQGIQTIINLEDEVQAINQEQIWVKQLRDKYQMKIKTISMPMKHWEVQSHFYIQQILAQINNPANGNVLVHCTAGADRTGLIMGLNRVQYQHWNPNDAYREMLQYHFHVKFTPLKDHFWWEVQNYPSMVSFFNNYPEIKRNLLAMLNQ